MSGKLAEYKSYEKTRKLQQAVESQFSLIPTLQRLDADPNLQGEGITIAFLDYVLQ